MLQVVLGCGKTHAVRNNVGTRVCACVRDVCVLSLFSNDVRTDSCPFRNYCFWTLCGFTGRHNVHIWPSRLPPYSVGSGFSSHEKPLSSGRSYEAWGLGTIVLFLSLLRALTWSEGGGWREGEIGDTVASHYWWDLTFYKVVRDWISDDGTVAPRGSPDSWECLVTAFHQLVII